MRFLTWNIQWGRGADGCVDLSRTIDVLHSVNDLDAFCLQELAQNITGLPGGDCGDQVAELAAAFPGWSVFFAPGLDVPAPHGGRSCFGNLIMTRRPVGQVLRHVLPMPADASVPGLRRSCIELVVEGADGAVRLLTTHLEYYSVRQRDAQIEALRAIQLEAVEQSQVPVCLKKDGNPVFMPRPRPVSAVLCGDLNCEPESDSYRLLARSADEPSASWHDAWRLAHPQREHAPTVGLHGAEWPDRAYCCDYFWVAGMSPERVLDVWVIPEVDASDHQPVVLDLLV